MALKTRLTIKGVNAARQTIEFTKGSIVNFDKPLEKVRQHMLTVINNNFRSKGTRFGEPWKELAPATIEEKERLAKLGAIKKSVVREPLIRTGEMKSNFRGRIIKRGEKNTRQLVIDNPTPYFMKHQSMRQSSRTVINLEGKKITLPRRVMMKITDSSERRIRDIFFQHLRERSKRKT